MPEQKDRYLINGEPAAEVSAADRGLQYGDGLFETVAVIAGQPRLWDRHLARLQLGARRLGIVCPDEVVLQRDASRLTQGMAANGVLKIVVTRGQGGRGYRPRVDTPPTRILSLHPFPEYPSAYWTTGVDVRLCATRLSEQPALAGIKHLNRLDQVIARGEWDNESVAEGLMLDQNGGVIEGTFTNLFALRAGRLYTADLARCGVAGVMRQAILDHCDGQGVPLRLVPGLSLDELEAAEEVFLSNSLIGVWPVRTIDDAPLRGGKALVDRLLKWLYASGTIPEPL